MLRREEEFGGQLVPILIMIVVQIISGTYSVLAGELLAERVDPLFLIYSCGIVTTFYVAPVAACVERGRWPERVGWKLMVNFVLIAIGGVTTYQILLLLGLQKTSPAVASAMSNLSPGLVFLIACSLRFEKFDVKCMYSIVKAAGTLLSLGGVIAVSLLQQGGDGSPSPPSLSPTVGVFIMGANQEWITGCICLISSVFMMSCTTVLQAATLKDLPAPLSITAITSLIVGVFTATIQLISNGKLDPGNYTIPTRLLTTYILVGGVVNSICIAVQMWCIRMQGPVFVSMFHPISTIISAVLSAVVLGKFLTLGSIAGIFVMIIGLYTILWAKRNEMPLPMHSDCRGNGDDTERILVNDINFKEALLS